MLLRPRFRRSLTFCLAAERAEENIWQWILLDRAPASSSSSPAFVQPSHWAYKGSMLYPLMDAQAFWSHHHDPLREAWTTFLRAMDAKRASNIMIPLATPGAWLLKQLRTIVSERVSPTVFDWLSSSMSVWQADQMDRLYGRAYLSLRHPSQPDPSKALEFLRQCAGPAKDHPFVRDLLHPPRAESSAHIFWFIVRAAQQLDRARKTTDANWALDFGRENFPGSFNMRPTTSPLDRSKNLYHDMRRKATAAQLQRGVPVDADGCAVTDPSLANIYRAAREVEGVRRGSFRRMWT